MQSSINLGVSCFETKVIPRLWLTNFFVPGIDTQRTDIFVIAAGKTLGMGIIKRIVDKKK
jgi:hypothetical protein